MIKNKKNQIKYGILALLFSFLTFGIFKNVEASPQGSSAQVMLEPAEIRVQNNGNQTFFLSRAWAGIRSGIGNILNAPVRFFRWLFGGRAATPIVVEYKIEEEEEEVEIEEEEEDKTEIPTTPTTGNSVILDTPSTSVSTAIHDVQGIIENKNEEDEIIIEEEEQVD